MQRLLGLTFSLLCINPLYAMTQTQQENGPKTQIVETTEKQEYDSLQFLVNNINYKHKLHQDVFPRFHELQKKFQSTK